MQKNIKERISDVSCIFFCPDGYSQTALSYVPIYLDVPTARSEKDLYNADLVLFSWAFSWQDLSWVSRVGKPVIIGGSYVNASQRDALPVLDNVEYFYGDVDSEDCQETRIMPDFRRTLEEDPYQDFLKVYSGMGCPWAKCTFCILHGNQRFKQFSPQYVASVVSTVARLGKLSGLSAQVHTVDWLCDLEKAIPENGRLYWSYVRAGDQGWHRLRKMRDAYIGSEYLSDSVLQRVRKGVSVTQIISDIETILAAGINVYTNIIEDLWQTPEEQEEHYNNLSRLLRRTTYERKLGSGALHMQRTCLVPKTYS